MRVIALALIPISWGTKKEACVGIRGSVPVVRLWAELSSLPKPPRVENDRGVDVEEGEPLGYYSRAMRAG